MKSAFAQLLEQGQDWLHQQARGPVAMHFTWDGTSGPESWSCWPGLRIMDRPNVYKGASGEQALRRFVEAVASRS